MGPLTGAQVTITILIGLIYIIHVIIASGSSISRCFTTQRSAPSGVFLYHRTRTFQLARGFMIEPIKTTYNTAQIRPYELIYF